MNFLSRALTYIFTASNWGGRPDWVPGSSSTCSTRFSRRCLGAHRRTDRSDHRSHTARRVRHRDGVNALRALPTLGVLLLGVLLLGLGLVPPTIALMLLGNPATAGGGTYAGIANVDHSVVDAARSMGMTETQILTRVEVPNALPLILRRPQDPQPFRWSPPRPSPPTRAWAAWAAISSTGSKSVSFIALVGALANTRTGARARRIARGGRLGLGARGNRFRRLPSPLMDELVGSERKSSATSGVVVTVRGRTTRVDDTGVLPSHTVEGVSAGNDATGERGAR